MQTEPAKRIGADLDAGPAMPSTIRTWPQAGLQVMVAQSGSARFMTMMMHGHVAVGQGLGTRHPSHSSIAVPWTVAS